MPLRLARASPGGPFKNCVAFFLGGPDAKSIRECHIRANPIRVMPFPTSGQPAPTRGAGHRPCDILGPVGKVAVSVGHPAVGFLSSGEPTAGPRPVRPLPGAGLGPSVPAGEESGSRSLWKADRAAQYGRPRRGTRRTSKASSSTRSPTGRRDPCAVRAPRGIPHPACRTHLVVHDRALSVETGLNLPKSQSRSGDNSA